MSIAEIYYYFYYYTHAYTGNEREVDITAAWFFIHRIWMKPYNNILEEQEKVTRRK